MTRPQRSPRTLLAARASLPWLVMPLTVVAGDGPVTLPSGADVVLHEVIHEDDAALLRLRYLVPAIGHGYGDDPDMVFADMLWLCETRAATDPAAPAPTWTEVVVTFMEEPVRFGDTRPDVVQLIDAFTREGTACNWSGE